MTSNPCKHVEVFFSQKTNIIAYKNIINYFVFPRSEKGFSHKLTIRCKLCDKNGSSSNLLRKEFSRPKCILVCAHCIHFACWHEQHINFHRKEFTEHVLSICLDRGELYCSTCKDFVYHETAEAFHRTAYRAYMVQFGLSIQVWRPSFTELGLLPHISPVLPLFVKSGSRSMRGLINMGNTCFLNVVIQALTHTPVLRDYLLADLHRCDNLARSRNCLACEMVRITQEIYRPVVTPFVPNNLLYAIWLHASHLAGYEQRDAHEILITLLTLIHGHLVGESASRDEDSIQPINVLTKHVQSSSRACGYSSSSNHSVTSCSSSSSTASSGGGSGHNSSANRDSVNCTNNISICQQLANSDAIVQPDCSSQTSGSSSRDTTESCDCIIHQVFFGDLESVISYEGCEHRSSTVDPFLDLSLDVIQRGTTSLQACLTSYFRPESIDGLIVCSHCNVGRPAVKQFSLLHLPNVLCFYLKRCHHDTKINTSITFPAELDMAPYLHQNVSLQSAWQNRYSLYAVLNHSGQTNFGHYIAYIRVAPGAWCLCDDQKIVPVQLNDVLHTDAYVLLYHKNLLAVRI